MIATVINPLHRLSALIVASLLWLSANAGAEDRVASARALFNLGRALMASGRYAEACPKFEESLRLEPGMGTRFNLAYCWEHLGRSASAWALYLDVAAEARAVGLGEREQIARKLARELEPRLSYLLVTVDAPSPGQEIARDGVLLGHAAWGIPTPVDPGIHVVRAAAPGKRLWFGSINVPARHFVYGLNVPALTDLPADTSLSARDWWSVGVGAGAAAAFATGSVLALSASARARSAAEVCPDYMAGGCRLSERAERDRWVDQARTLRNRAIVSFAVGGAAAISAAILLAFDSDAEEPEPRVQLGLLGDGWGPCLGGAW